MEAGGAWEQPYIAFDEMLSQGPTSTRPRSQSLQSTIKYDMDSHYRFGGTAPQGFRDPRHAALHATLLEFITKEGTPGVMPSEPKLRGAGREDLISAINSAGGWSTVAGALGLQISHSLREVYFKCPPSRRAGQEVEFTLPGMPQRFAATIPEGVEPGDEFIVRVPPVLPSAAHGFARGLDEATAKQRLVMLAQEMEQMKLMAHEIAVIKRSVRTQDKQVSALKQRNDQLRADAQVEATRRAELAASLDRAAPVLLTGPMITQSLTPADRLPRPLSGATWDGPPRDGRGPEPEPEPEPEMARTDEDVRRELRAREDLTALTLRVLKARAREAGASDAAVDGLDDALDSKAAAIDLVLRHTGGR